MSFEASRSSYLVVATRMVGKLSVNHACDAGFVSQMPASSGTGPSNSRWHQRAMALPNSRPMRPSPMIPNRTFLRAAMRHSFPCLQSARSAASMRPARYSTAFGVTVSGSLVRHDGGQFAL